MKYFIIFTSLFSLLAFSSCTKDDPCENKDCGSYGNCVAVDDEADCQCESGYTKDADGKCEIFSISQFQNTWQVKDSCNNRLQTGIIQMNYVSDISLASGTEIRITNLAAEGCTVDALVDGNNFSIKTGKYCVDAGGQTEYTFSGGGKISDTGIMINYEYTYSIFGGVTTSRSCVATFKK